MSLVVEDYSQLYALFRGLLEAKFSADPEDPDLQASPIVGSILLKTIVEIKKILEKDGDVEALKDWATWQGKISKSSREWVVCFNSATKTRAWETWDQGSKRKYTKDLFCPFILEERDLVEFEKAVDLYLTGKK